MFYKISVFSEISVVLAKQDKLEDSNNIIINSIKMTEGLNGAERSGAKRKIRQVKEEIAVVLANQGEIDKSIQTSEGIKIDWSKGSTFTDYQKNAKIN